MKPMYYSEPQIRLLDALEQLGCMKMRQAKTFLRLCFGMEAVSYTHLDVYKRQDIERIRERQELERLRRQRADWAAGMTDTDQEDTDYDEYEDTEYDE